MRGYVQIYTGFGKGKTTAALGLALRAVGAGLRVYIAQLMKRGDYGEIKALKLFGDAVRVEQFGSGRFVRGKPSLQDIDFAHRAVRLFRRRMLSGAYDVMVLDEGNAAVSSGILGIETLIELIDSKPESVELIITGRNAVPEVIAKADLVTEMREIKHYFHQGVKAREGIEK